MLRVRNSWSASVPAEWREPIRTAFPCPRAIERDAAKDEGAKEDLAQLRIGLDEAAQVLVAQLQDARDARGPGPHDGRAPGEQVDVARRTLRDDAPSRDGPLPRRSRPRPPRPRTSDLFRSPWFQRLCAIREGPLGANGAMRPTCSGVRVGNISSWLPSVPAGGSIQNSAKMSSG